MQITIYHNPRCSNSRGALALIREAGFEPTVIDYLQHPPERAVLRQLMVDSGESLQSLVRSKEAVFTALGLDAPGTSDEAVIDAMLAHPVLINRPLVVTPLGTRLCRPSDKVLEILPVV
jgi:arsenate reductase